MILSVSSFNSPNHSTYHQPRAPLRLCRHWSSICISSIELKPIVCNFGSNNDSATNTQTSVIETQSQIPISEIPRIKLFASYIEA